MESAAQRSIAEAVINEPRKTAINMISQNLIIDNKTENAEKFKSEAHIY